MPIQIENLTLYDLDEVSAVLNKHPNTIRAYIGKGEVIAKKINGAYYVTRANLEKHVKEVNLPPEIIDYRLGEKPLPRKKKATERSIPATA